MSIKESFSKSTSKGQATALSWTKVSTRIAVNIPIYQQHYGQDNDPACFVATLGCKLIKIHAPANENERTALTEVFRRIRQAVTGINECKRALGLHDDYPIIF